MDAKKFAQKQYRDSLLTKDQKIARAKAGMERLNESKRRAAIKTGRRCFACETFIGDNAAFETTQGRACSLECAGTAYHCGACNKIHRLPTLSDDLSTFCARALAEAR